MQRLTVPGHWPFLMAETGGPPAPPAIEVRALQKDYRGLRPLRIQSLTLKPGERASLAGVDAAAAEALINLLTGATLPDEGEVLLLGRNTVDIANEVEWLASLDRVGIVTVRAVLLEASPLADSLALPFTLTLDPIPQDVRARITQLAREVGLPDAALAQRAAEATPAVRVRVHLARALALDPQTLLLEHPTATLQAAETAPLAESIRAIAGARGLSLLAITEDEGFAKIVAERRWRLHPATGEVKSVSERRRWF